MIFVGYCLSHSPHTYRMFNLKTEHVVFSRDVSWLNMTNGFWNKKKRIEIDLLKNKISEIQEFEIKMPREKVVPTKQKTSKIGFRNTRQNSELRITRSKAKARISYKDMANVSRELVCLVVSQSVDPVSFNQAWMHENVSERKCWRIVIEDELKMMMDKEVWSIVKKPENARMLGMKWVFKKKTTVDIEQD